MRIESRFTLSLAFCLCLGLAISAYISFQLESRQARDEVKQKADMLLETGLAIRAYTSEEVGPALQTLQGGTGFNVQQVPSFSAQNAIHRLTRKYPEYQYREPSLNPTNVKDRANDWEVGLIRDFQAKDKLGELSGEIGGSGDRRFYVARPIRLSNPACLQCHSVPAAAPAPMVAQYGPVNGFGWKLGEVVALQVVEVPSKPAHDKALRSVLVTVGSLACVFVLSAAVFLLLLRRHVTYPLERLTQAAHSISVDGAHAQQPAFAVKEAGQFSELHEAIIRLRASMDSALKRIAAFSKQDDDAGK
ncbi:DUF3365 domain-containing protein [Ideonella azotifigens]|uniref:DUF3365 domain-containing protein n=1 Tax=Ideonella azotifigens TaxID=513160 RepID=A0ABP3VL82_9BURK|nr:DUF3365 domain-containing protein [Ideonella azotifigens]MCD2343687.1 DUF3365 domain-containing protein [Ideonella azotifigens]